ncbi:eukaryotic translation initiation factor-like protein 2C 2 [Cadophora sp. MPI-SDFR-AT-0126]|nr:eukaryotic translation initiation factor-like protein 2C 2 [Leotiomycetes sp. MPI-SDFR-AT-0126]
MAGGAGRQRAGDGNGHGNNGQYQGGPPQQYHQYQPQGPINASTMPPPKPRSGGFDGPGEHSRNPSGFQGPSPGQQGFNQGGSNQGTPLGTPLLSPRIPQLQMQSGLSPGSPRGSPMLMQAGYVGQPGTPGRNTPQGSQPNTPGRNNSQQGTPQRTMQRGPPQQYQGPPQQMMQQGPPQQQAVGGLQGQRGPNPFGPGMGFGPARPIAPKEKVITNTRVELPPDAYQLEGAGYQFESQLPYRNGYNTTGRAVNIQVNQYKVLDWIKGDVHQYDINIGNGAEKRGKIMAVWKSRAVQERLRQAFPPGALILWDGNKLAWSKYRIGEQRIKVNFDVEKGRAPRPDKPADEVYVIIRPTTQIRMAVIGAYLNKSIQFDKSVLEAITFLDHCMRQGPSEQYTMIKRSFFSRGTTSHQLDNVVVAMKGVYTSIRLCSPTASIGAPGTGLALNVDVANGTFWAAQDVHQAARNYCSQRNRALSYTVFRDLLLPVKDGKGGWAKSEDFKNLSRFVKLKFIVKHRGKGDDKKEYAIKKFTFEKGEAYSKTGAHAKNTYFKFRDRNTGNEQDITVFDYFKRTYNIELQCWWLPLIITERAGMFPMELCTLSPNQRYNFKLSPEQTSNMIKFAVTRPKQRVESIVHGINMLKWPQDRYLNHFDIKVDPKMTMTQARVLQNPEIQFAGAKLNPGTQGRWDLRGKKFLLPNPEPLNSWGFVILGGCTSEQTVRNFANVFISTYVGHGGKVANKNPLIYNQSRSEDIPTLVNNARRAVGDQVKAMPQILFYVLPGRDSFMYERLKKNSECRFAMMSQCLNVAHVNKAQPQYCSNVCMKVNAKLGGTTSKVVTPKGFFTRPTMIIGADVSHPAPGSPQASMAAVTMSFDKDCCRYAAAVQTNGYRVEMITKDNIEQLILPYVKQWVSRVGGGNLPHHIYYFRDGVSEGQYSHVLSREVADMKAIIAQEYKEAANNIKWTVAVCTKRHHIRFFPKEGDSQAADRNANALPGTLVEKDITHPYEYDFYLCSHAAIQGTARPVHYHVLKDEANVPVNEFQKMIYHFSYQYMRSTTPVSLFPAIYYAHLASNRARAHESAPASDGPRGGQKFEERRAEAARQGTNDGTSQTGSSKPSEAAPLLPIGNPDQQDLMWKIRSGMWYI